MEIKSNLSYSKTELMLTEISLYFLNNPKETTIYTNDKSLVPLIRSRFPDKIVKCVPFSFIHEKVIWEDK